jgi:GT2 family glycosyltransferase
MDLSIIIVCYRGWEKLSKCLESIASFAGNEFSMEVIVVDNNSGDGKIDEFKGKYPQFRFIHNCVNGGYANGCNLGAAEAAGNNLLILNPDTVAGESEIGKLLREVTQNPDYFIISCRQVRQDGKESKATGLFPGLFSSGRKSIKKSNRANKNISYPDWVSGSVMIMRKEVFDRLNGFDEDFWMYSEDIDLCKRARDLGGEIAFYSDITIEHNHGGSTRSDIVTASITKTEVQISRHLYIHKHKSGVERILIQTLIFLDNLVTGIVTGVVGLVFFFIPKMFVRFLLLLRLFAYYMNSLFMGTWLSRRSVNYKKHLRD